MTKKRAILGNGYMGCELSNNLGQGLGRSESNTPNTPFYLGGVYGLSTDTSNRNTLSAIFRPINPIALINKEHEKLSSSKKIKDFNQKLDMQNALISTHYIASGDSGDYATNTEVFLSRSRPHIGCMQIEYSPIKLKANSGNQPIKYMFTQYLRKDPRVEYETLYFENPNLGQINIFSTIREDYFDFHKKGPLKIIQKVVIRFYDEKNQLLKGDFHIQTKNPSAIRLNQDYEIDHHASISIRGGFRVVILFGIYKSDDYNGDLEKASEQDFTDAMTLDYDTLKTEHCDAWNNQVWKRRILVSDVNIQHMIDASMYALASSLHPDHANSLGPNGLLGSAWSGRAFWDADLWVNLGLLLWAPELSHSIVGFRKKTLPGGAVNRDVYAKAKNYPWLTEGAKIAWESGSSGYERGPANCCIEHEEHINCNVIYAQYLYYTVTIDETYLKENAYPISVESCKYLSQRVRKEADGKYHYRQIIPADEFAPHFIDDDAFTNLFVSICMRIVVDWSKKLNQPYPKVWEEIRDNMFYNFDSDKQLVIEYTGYKGQKIKQADVDLLTFPLEYPFSNEIKRNNMIYYFSKLPKEHILMGSAIFSIIACELGFMDNAWTYFKDQFAHFHPEQFYIASESPKNSCWPFVTGLGGFLMNIIYGFGGIRLRKDGLKLTPHISVKLPRIQYQQLHFQGNVFNYEIMENNMFQITAIDQKIEFRVYVNNNQQIKAQNSDSILKLEWQDEPNNEKSANIVLEPNSTIKFIV